MCVWFALCPKSPPALREIFHSKLAHICATEGDQLYLGLDTRSRFQIGRNLYWTSLSQVAFFASFFLWLVETIRTLTVSASLRSKHFRSGLISQP